MTKANKYIVDEFLEQTGRPTNKRGKRLERKKQQRKAANSNILEHNNISLKPIVPLTPNQKKAFEIYDKGKMPVLIGVAGTGKTYVSSYFALKEMMNKRSEIKKIIIIRSAVQSREMGFTTGDVNQKEEPYKQIYKSIFSEILGRDDAFAGLERKGAIQFMTTSFLRGLTFNDAIVIFDEIQNCNFTEISTVISRLGKNSRLIMSGDYRQTDLIKRNDQSGFSDFLKVANKMEEFGIVDFEPEDIVRSGFVKSWFVALAKTNLN